MQRNFVLRFHFLGQLKLVFLLQFIGSLFARKDKAFEIAIKKALPPCFEVLLPLLKAL